MGKALDAFEALTKRTAPPIAARPERVIEDDAVVRTKRDGQIVVERGQTQQVVDRSSESLID